MGRMDLGRRPHEGRRLRAVQIGGEENIGLPALGAEAPSPTGANFARTTIPKGLRQSAQGWPVAGLPWVTVPKRGQP